MFFLWEANDKWTAIFLIEVKEISVKTIIVIHLAEWITIFPLKQNF